MGRTGSGEWRGRVRAGVVLLAGIAALVIGTSSAAGDPGRFGKAPVPEGHSGESPYASPDTPVPGDAVEPGRPLEIDRDAAGNPYVAGELLVSFAPRATGREKRRVASDADAEVEERFGEIDAQLIEIPEVEGAAILERTIEEIESDPAVESADPNYVHETHATPNDEFFPLMWGLQRIRAPQAWDRTVGANTVINVLDSGIVIDNLANCNANAAHEDIGGVISQFDFFNNDPCAEDRNQHGTHTAGTAAALTNNVDGIAGVSPAGLLLIGKVCEDSEGGLGGSATCPIADQVDALLAAGSLPQSGIPRPDVINMSLGGPTTTTQQRDAVRFATGRGIVLVVSAGNENDDALKFPAAYPEAIAVASTNIANGKSRFSNFGPWVDIAAPGGDFDNPAPEDILSTVPLGPSTYQFLNGTSMAAPHVAGVASLIAAQGRSASQIRNRLESGARDLGAPGKDSIFGHGLVDAAEATLPASRTRACASASAALDAARAPLAGLREALDAAQHKKKAARKKVTRAKKAKRKAKKQGSGKKLGKAKDKLRNKKRKLRRAKNRLASAEDALAAAEGAVAGPAIRQANACND